MTKIGAGLDDEDITQILPRVGTIAPLANPLELRHGSLLLQNESLVTARRPAPPLIEGMLSQGTTALLYGPSGVGKSFLALDFALCVATGTSCLNRTVTQGSVVYLAGEAEAGLGARITAWKLAHGMEGDAELFFLLEAVQLADKATVPELIALISMLCPTVALVVIDTLARSMTGLDENSSQGMGLIVDAMTQIARQLPTTVLGIHHTGKRGNDP
jgi:predicted ATP-dependent serine protease